MMGFISFRLANFAFRVFVFDNLIFEQRCDADTVVPQIFTT